MDEGYSMQQLGDMVTELIRIVGNTNLIVSGLRNDMNAVKADIAELKTDVVELKTRAGNIENDVAEIKKTQEYHTNLLETMGLRITKNEAEIYGLKKAL